MANTTLTVSIQKASQQVAQRIKLGREIREGSGNKTASKHNLDLLWDSIKKWDDYNNTFLRKLFSDESVANKYDAAVTFSGYQGLPDYTKKILSFYRIKMRELNSIKERLTLYTIIPQGTSIASPNSIPLGNKVFIVHGHDDAIKNTVARFLEKLDIDVVILHEQPDKGKTIIEKLEANSSEVDIGYAVVLLTPDDKGIAASKYDYRETKLALQSRARQNVVFELGYFMAKIGRERVRALYIEGVELPSDYKGVLYTKLDDSDSWKYELAREIKAAGINFNINNLL